MASLYATAYIRVVHSAKFTDFLHRVFLQLRYQFAPSGLLGPVIGAVAGGGRMPERRALFVYLAMPFRLNKSDPAFRNHQSLRQSVQIAQVLGEFGYTVDVVDLTDKKFKPSQVYDLVLCHRVDHAGLEAAIGPDTLKVYLSSGTNHSVHNRRLAERLEELATRKGLRLKNVYWESESMPFPAIADALVGFGNQAVVDTWASVVAGPRWGFPNYGFASIDNPHRDWTEARRHFLFLGSTRQVGKGLDLLLDVFSAHPDLHLHVCSKYEKEPEFCDAYARELFATPNIHPCGWIDIGSRKFRDLAATCAYIILPSCSEGSPGSIANGMFAGLIPIVTMEAGVDTGDFGFTLADHRMDTIEAAITGLAELPPEQVAARSLATRRAAEEHYSESSFLARWREIMSEMMARP